MELEIVDCEWIHLGYGVVLERESCVIEARGTKHMRDLNSQTVAGSRLPAKRRIRLP